MLTLVASSIYIKQQEFSTFKSLNI